MKIAITDACIFIDLHELNLTPDFFTLNFEIHTSLDVFNEVYPEQQQLLNVFVKEGRLKVHSLQSAERIAIMATAYPISLSEVDKTVLYLAKKHDAIVLSSDKTVRNYAKSQAIDYHGMLWIFDQLIAQNILSSAAAATKLKELIAANIFYQNNSTLMLEFKKRIKIWDDLNVK
jgi:hypothetical protein